MYGLSCVQYVNVYIGVKVNDKNALGVHVKGEYLGMRLLTCITCSEPNFRKITVTL